MKITEEHKLDKWKDKLKEVTITHAQTTGILAGFSIAIIAIIITLFDKTNGIDNSFAIYAIKSFLSSFIGYTACAIIFTLVMERDDLHQVFLFCISCCLYYLSSVLLFAGLYPLLSISMFQGDFKWIALITISGATFGGFLAAAIPFQDFLKIKKSWIFLIFSIALFISIILFFLHDNEKLLNDIIIGNCFVIIILFTCCITSFFGFLNYFIRSKERTAKLSLLLFFLSTVSVLITTSLLIKNLHPHSR